MLVSSHIIIITIIIILTEHWSEIRDFVGSFVHQPGIYRDIMDEKVYQEYRAVVKKNGFFPITLLWHLDGTPAMKSKILSLWPIQSSVHVVELPLNAPRRTFSCRVRGMAGRNPIWQYSKDNLSIK